MSAASSITGYRGSETPSLLNGAGSGKSIPIVGSHRTSNGQASASSPPQSRSSSAEGSYSTTATTFEDTEDTTRGRSRDEADNMPDSKRNSRTKEIKGNVIVSVRVRPDVAGQDASRAEGEWMVDGRRSLVAYRGREGGDYHYGGFKHICNKSPD
jgi:centromeric protein E